MVTLLILGWALCVLGAVVAFDLLVKSRIDKWVLSESPSHLVISFQIPRWALRYLSLAQGWREVWDKDHPINEKVLQTWTGRKVWVQEVDPSEVRVSYNPNLCFRGTKADLSL